MTQLKQFTALVTGSDLTPNFRRARLILTTILAVGLGAVLIISSSAIYSLARQRFESQRLQILEIPFPPAQDLTQGDFNNQFARLKQLQDKHRLENLINAEQDLVINNLALFLILVLVTWLGLYYLLKPLSNANVQQAEFLANASHELRTPLAILNSELNLSLKEADLEKVRQINRGAIIEINRLHKMSERLLGQLRTKNSNLHSSQTHNLQSPKINLEQTIREIWFKVQTVSSKKLILEFNFDHSNSFENLVNDERFEQILHNILNNVSQHGLDNSNLLITKAENSLKFQNPTDQTHYNFGTGLKVCQSVCRELGIELLTKLENGLFEVELKRSN